jgi:hypothetical protein
MTHSSLIRLANRQGDLLATFPDREGKRVVTFTNLTKPHPSWPYGHDTFPQWGRLQYGLSDHTRQDLTVLPPSPDGEG